MHTDPQGTERIGPAKPVLNVEDHAPSRFLRTHILHRAGFGVEETGSGIDAIARARNASLVLLDVSLPDTDGFTVCERIKQLMPALPVVMVTSVYRTVQARRDAFAVGADAYLLEPLDPAQLVRTVERLLGVGHSRVATGDGWIVTDAAGDIVNISASAAALLNLSVRGARGRSLPAFFVDNRARLVNELTRAVNGINIERVSMLLPRDRRPVRVRLDLSALPRPSAEPVHLRWVLSVDS